jgi:hypothetical protein
LSKKFRLQAELPPVVRLLGDSELSADFGDRRSVLYLLQRQGDLLI